RRARLYIGRGAGFPTCQVCAIRDPSGRLGEPPDLFRWDQRPRHSGSAPGNAPGSAQRLRLEPCLTPVARHDSLPVDLSNAPLRRVPRTPPESIWWLAGPDALDYGKASVAHASGSCIPPQIAMARSIAPHVSATLARRHSAVASPTAISSASGPSS